MLFSVMFSSFFLLFFGYLTMQASWRPNIEEHWILSEYSVEWVLNLSNWWYLDYVPTLQLIYNEWIFYKIDNAQTNISGFGCEMSWKSWNS